MNKQENEQTGFSAGCVQFEVRPRLDNAQSIRRKSLVQATCAVSMCIEFDTSILSNTACYVGEEGEGFEDTQQNVLAARPTQEPIALALR